MVFLIVAAVAFVVGLNLFAYWSVQVRYINHLPFMNDVSQYVLAAVCLARYKFLHRIA